MNRPYALHYKNKLMTQTQTPLKVVLLGMENHFQGLISKLFNGPLNGYCSIVNDDTADFAILDMDRRGTHALWLDFKKRVDKPAIVLSLTETHFPDTVCVLKPLQIPDLSAALRKIQLRVGRQKRRIEKKSLIDKNPQIKREVLSHLSSQPHKATFNAAELSYSSRDAASFCGDIEEKWYRQEDIPEKLFYAPEFHLQGILSSAVKEVHDTNRPVLLRGLGRDIIVFVGGRYVHTSMPTQQMRAICNISFEERYIDFLFKRNHSFNSSSLRHKAIKSEHILWNVTLWSSRGRLPFGTDIDRPFSLSSWPNLTRLTRTPHAFQLAALWYKQTISLRATAILLNVSPRYIYTFYSACLQQGLVQEDLYIEAYKEPSTVKPSRGILSRLMGFLRRKVEN